MASSFCCGFECGVVGVAGSHNPVLLSAGDGAVAIITSPVNSGLRAMEATCGATSDYAAVRYDTKIDLTQREYVLQFRVRFKTALPGGDMLFYVGENTLVTTVLGVGYNATTGAIECLSGTSAGGAFTWAGGGVTVVADTWYRIDVKQITSANPWTIDAQVDGVSITQKTGAFAAANLAIVAIGVYPETGSGTALDVLFDDVRIGVVDTDYPFAAGHAHPFTPTSDGTHNVAGTNDFERSLTGTDIDNATTTAYQLVDDVPLETTETDFINLIAPANATDYVEVVFGAAPGISAPTVAPITVDFIVGHHSAGTLANNLRVAYRDSNGATQADVINKDISDTAMGYSSTHFATIPGGTGWTLTAFQNSRARVYTSDAAPDPYVDGLMIEAWFEDGILAEIDSALRKVTASLNAEKRYTTEVDSTLVKVSASLIAYLRPEAEIDSVVRKLTAALSVSHQQQLTVASTLRKVTASINVEQRQLVTVGSAIVKAAANVNVEQQAVSPLLTIVSTLRKVTSNVNVQQEQRLTIVSTLAKVAASLNAEQRYLLTIDSDLAKVLASLNASHQQRVTIDSDIVKVAASIAASHEQRLTIDSDLSKVTASLNASQRYELQIASALAKVMASLAAEAEQTGFVIRIGSTIGAVSAALLLMFELRRISGVGLDLPTSRGRALDLATLSSIGVDVPSLRGRAYDEATKRGEGKDLATLQGRGLDT